MKSLFNLSALLLALALPMGTALAQDESTDDTSMEDDDGVMDDGAAEDGEGDASSEPAAESESADSAGAYPLAAQSRPLTLPKGMIQISGSLAHVSLAFVDSSGGSTTSTATAMAAGGFYGVSDKIQVGAVTSLGIDPDVEWGEHLDLSGYYLVHDSEQLDVAAGVGIPLNFGDGDVLPGFTLDAYTRYIINDKISVNTGDNLLAIGIDPSAINLNMNIGGAFQATEQLSVGGGTQLASIAISGDGNETTTLGDVIPLYLGGLFAISSELDALATISFASLEDAADLYALSVGVNYRLGK